MFKMFMIVIAMLLGLNINEPAYNVNGEYVCYSNEEFKSLVSEHFNDGESFVVTEVQTCVGYDREKREKTHSFLYWISYDGSDPVMYRVYTDEPLDFK